MSVIRRLFTPAPRDPSMVAEKEADRQARRLLTRKGIDDKKVEQHVRKVIRDFALKPNSTKDQYDTSAKCRALEKIYSRYPEEVGKIVHNELKIWSFAPRQLRAMADHYEQSSGLISPEFILRRLEPVEPRKEVASAVIAKLKSGICFGKREQAKASVKTLFSLLDSKTYQTDRRHESSLQEEIRVFLTTIAKGDNIKNPKLTQTESPYKQAVSILTEEALTIFKKWQRDPAHTPLPHPFIAEFMEKWNGNTVTTATLPYDYKAVARKILDLHRANNFDRKLIMDIVEDISDFGNAYFDEEGRPLKPESYRILQVAQEKYPEEVDEAVHAALRNRKMYHNVPVMLADIVAHHENTKNIRSPFSALYYIHQEVGRPLTETLQSLKQQEENLSNKRKKNVDLMKELDLNSKQFPKNKNKNDEQIYDLLRQNINIDNELKSFPALREAAKQKFEKPLYDCISNVTDDFMIRLTSSDPDVAQNAAVTITELLQCDVPQLREELAERIRTYIDAYHAGQRAPGVESKEKAEKVFNLLKDGAKQVISAWAKRTRYKEDPHHLNALLILIAAQRQNDTGLTALTSIANEIFSRYRQSTEKFPVPKVEVHRFTTTNQDSKTREKAISSWKNYFSPQPPLSNDKSMKLLESKERGERDLGLANLCSKIDQTSTIEQLAYEHVTETIKSSPLSEVSPVLAFLARRYPKASEDFKKKYSDIATDKMGFDLILHEDSTKLNRLVTLEELSRVPRGGNEDVMFAPQYHQYESEPVNINQQLMDFRRSKAKYLVMPVHNGLHYVTMVVTKSEEKRSNEGDIYEEYKRPHRDPVRLHASVLETLSGDNTRLNGFLKKLNVDSCTLNAGKLQEGPGRKSDILDLENMTNSCGIFSTLVYDHLLHSLEQRKPNDPTPLEADTIVKDFVRDFTALEPEDRKQINLFRRLQIFDNYLLLGPIIYSD